MRAMPWNGWIRGAEIEPSLYAADFLRLGDQIEALLGAGARVFHVDVGDGHFIPPVTIGPVVVESIAPLVHGAGGRIDCHLMVADPTAHFAQIRDAGGDSVTFHVETVEDPVAAIALARDLGLGVGVACNPDTPVERLVQAALGADLALCMSVHPGYSGQPFLADSLDRVRRIRELAVPRLPIQVDGGVGLANVSTLHEAGATLLVAGSSIFSQSDIASAYTALHACLD